jgi:cell division septum initiation protein DivIVA
MPDQSSAANEHAILQEITAPLAILPDDPMPMVADVHFPVALRGYDRLAVDAYVKKTSQLVAELQATRSPEAAIRRALERVGEEVSGILKRAHETAEQLTAQSRREAEDRLEVARKEAAEMLVDAEQRLKDLDSETDRIWAERHRIIGDTRGLAQELLALAESAGQRFPAAEETAGLERESPVEESELEGDSLALEGDELPVDEEPGGSEAEHGASGPEPLQDPGTDVTAVLPPLPPENEQRDR